MRIVFVGSTQFGLRCLNAVSNLPDCNIVGIITNPSSFSISFNPNGVKNVLHEDFQPFSLKYNIPIYVMKDKMSDPELLKVIKNWGPDFILVVGWYHMIPKSILQLAPTAGLHASLLPDYSGGAPLVWAIINGEEKTGITFFMFDEGVDNGDIIGQKEEPIYFNDTIATLYDRIEERGLELLERHLPVIAKGETELTAQDNLKRRIMPQRKPEDGEIDWNWSTYRIYNFIRAQTRPYPGAFIFYKNNKVTIWHAKLFDWIPGKGTPGEVIAIVDEGPLRGILIATKNNDIPLLLTELEGSNGPINAIEFASEKCITAGSTFN